MNKWIGKRLGSRTFGITISAALLASVLAVSADAAPAAATQTAPAAKQTAAVTAAAASEQIYNRFLTLVQQPGQQASALAYLRAHIGKVTRYQASLMVLRLENAMHDGLPALGSRFSDSAVQQAIGEVYKPGDTLAVVRDRMTDISVQTLVNEASVRGYKLETSEGLFYPVVNYSIFHEFREHVSEDIDSYILIMAEESREAAVKDAAIVIGYQQLVRRTLTMERFLDDYPRSNRTAKVKGLFERYKAMTFYGTSNTELFGHDGEEMRPNARIGYANILKWVSADNSRYLSELRDFMALAEKYEYHNSAELRDFVKDIFAEA
ncbi:hypothetical protein [Paenibacillus sp. 1P07SE]|uniref:hypothetical protein n=1 Tax=Paenibacillus sp. 1P07SE TaxID=3132209 RepID=UPI0039A56EF1